VLGFARRGRGPARFAVAQGAFALALYMRDAAEAARLSPPVSVSWAGRLLEDRAYRSRVWRMARGLGLEIAPVAPRESALEAAARLARGGDRTRLRQAGEKGPGARRRPKGRTRGVLPVR